jgi:tRNA A37 threonylcarbamoyladenosine dehydratase
LAKKVRVLARKEGLRNIKVVTSLEEAREATFVPELNKVVVGSMIFVPASAGLLLASTVIQDLCQDDVIIKKMKTGNLWNAN